MFRTAELGQKVSKADFDAAADLLRIELIELQQLLRGADFPVVVVFAGVDGAGKSEMVNLLNEWMDPRWIVTRAYSAPSDEERERPPYWRFWRDLPPKGMMGLFLSCWYSRPILDRVFGGAAAAEFDEQLGEIAAFEKTVTDDGALILKFWMHLGKDAQYRRLKALEKDPLQSWRISKSDWRNWKNYDKFIAAAERALMHTGTRQAPWLIVEGSDARYRSLSVLTSLRDALRKHLDARAADAKAAQAQPCAVELGAGHVGAQPPEKTAGEELAAKPKRRKAGEMRRITAEQLHQHTVLDALDMGLALPGKEYGLALKKARADLNALQRKARDKGVSTILVFEGWDAAGKGGAIRRMTAALDARDYRVIPIAAPTDEERAQHYLWRFWRHLPRAGRFTVFDRSWYGRVLVERVEGLAANEEWMRAYAEINAFEEQLVNHGIVVAKFWLHITKDEQYRRFKAREVTAYKQWKLTDEDWRNRAKWDLYQHAINDMVEHTSTTLAPWTLVEANDKNYARVKVIETVCDRLRRRLK